MQSQLSEVLSNSDSQRNAASVNMDELRALGTTLVLEGADAAYPLKIESLNRFSNHQKTSKRPMWLLLSVHPSNDTAPERATVWVADAYRARFIKIFEDYLTKLSTGAAEEKWSSPDGSPANQSLVANIARIRQAVLIDLWTSDGSPPIYGLHWWELWLDASQPDLGTFNKFVSAYNLRSMPRSVAFRDRRVVWIEATWEQLQILPFTNVPIAELRRPEFVDTVEDLPENEQNEYVQDLANRLRPALASTAPVVCHLDTGVFRAHALLQGSLATSDVHTIIGTSGNDITGHGTSMAGLALFGNLDLILTSTEPIQLEHRLESVRMQSGRSEALLDPMDYGTATAQAVSMPEITASRSRVFCLPLSTTPDAPGEPTLWSSTIDALAVGTDIVREGDELRLLSTPNQGAKRLIIVAAGNVESYQLDHRTESDTSVIEDPAQAWNALTVSAYTDLAEIPSDPTYRNWVPLATSGGLSPHSRTSVLFSTHQWPIKPDICMEGGNVSTDGSTNFEVKHPLLSLRSTGISNDVALASANATSAATAQACRLAALIMARYPNYWPETVRGSLTHSAEWTPLMSDEIKKESSKTRRLSLLRRYGWGVPTEEAVLNSTQQAVTLVTQDEFIPFDGPNYKMRHFRLHDLPWPREALESVGEGEVRLRITLSYFIEPSPSRRGWRRRYAYASHGLRFDLQGPLETQHEFVGRVNRDAQLNEEGSTRSSSASNRWLIGPNQRHLGSLHQDEWTGTGQELAASNSIAVYPVGGWWKNNGSIDRVSLPIRYGLLVSLRTERQDIDLYTPIENQVRTPTTILA